METGLKVRFVPESEEQRDDESKEDDHNCGEEDGVPVNVEWGLITEVPAVGHPVPPQCPVDALTTVTPPHAGVRTHVTRARVSVVDRGQHSHGYTRGIVSRTGHVSQSTPAGARVRVVREEIAASPGLLALVTPVLTMLHPVTHVTQLYAADTAGHALPARALLAPQRLHGALPAGGLGAGLAGLRLLPRVPALARPLTSPPPPRLVTGTPGLGVEVASLPRPRSLVTVVVTLAVPVTYKPVGPGGPVLTVPAVIGELPSQYGTQRNH